VVAAADPAALYLRSGHLPARHLPGQCRSGGGSDGAAADGPAADRSKEQVLGDLASDDDETVLRATQAATVLRLVAAQDQLARLSREAPAPLRAAAISTLVGLPDYQAWPLEPVPALSARGPEQCALAALSNEPSTMP
jgi:hypothetical protein